MKSNAKNVSLTIKNKLSELQKVNTIFEQFTEKHELLLKVSNPLSMALDEILNNIISYGYRDEKDHEIDIHILLSPTSLSLRIEDDGIPFNPLDVKDADTKSELEDRAVGGLGMHLIKNMMDKLNYEYKNKKNCLILEKNIKET